MLNTLKCIPKWIKCCKIAVENVSNNIANAEYSWV